jgi:hypothetical protein
MSSAFIISQLLSNLLIDYSVHQKFHGTKESQEKFLEKVLKMKEEFLRLSNKENTRNQFDSIYLEITENQLDQSIQYLEKMIEEA